MDADEVFDRSLVDEIKDRIPKLGTDIVAVNLKRKHVFMHRVIRHGGRYPLILTRIWRNGKGRIEDRWMDEHIIVWGGGVVTFENYFSDYNLNDLDFFIDKHNKYSVREAIDVLNRKYNLFPQDNFIKNGAVRQARLKRLLKEFFYNNLPFGVGPLGYFIFRYFFQLGFLDGREGAMYHFLQGFWYRFLVDSKVYEYDRQIKKMKTRKDQMSKLESMTGCSFSKEGDV